MKMPKELKERWVAALRSGEYKQGHGRLCNAFGGYCCLGVLEMVADGEVEMMNSNKSQTMPSQEWYNSHNVSDQHDGAITVGALAEFNDDGHSFEDIATVIEAKVEVSDEG